MDDDDNVYEDIPELVRLPIGTPVVEDNLPFYVLFAILIIFFFLGFGVFYLIAWSGQTSIMEILPCDTSSCSSSASSMRL